MLKNNSEKRINNIVENQEIGLFVTVHKDLEEAKLCPQRSNAEGSEEIASGW